MPLYAQFADIITHGYRQICFANSRAGSNILVDILNRQFLVITVENCYLSVLYIQ